MDETADYCMKEKIKKLEQEKAEIEAEKQYIKHKEDIFKTLDLERIKTTLETHRRSVNKKDRKECKKFMKDYIKGIHVSNDKVVINYKLEITEIDDTIGTH